MVQFVAGFGSLRSHLRFCANSPMLIFIIKNFYQPPIELKAR